MVEPGTQQTRWARLYRESGVFQTIGIFGVGFTIFQGLEPFLRFSKLVAFLVSHWREITFRFWSWPVSLFNINIEPQLSDTLTVTVFVVLFGARAFVRPRVSFPLSTSIFAYLPDSTPGFITKSCGAFLMVLAFYMVVSLTIAKYNDSITSNLWAVPITFFVLLGLVILIDKTSVLSR